METLGQKVRIIRKGKGLEQEEVGEKAGISSGHLSRIENDKENPTVGMLERIAEALDYKVSIEFIPQGLVAEHMAEYAVRQTYSTAEQKYIDVLVNIMRSDDESAKVYIKGALDLMQKTIEGKKKKSKAA